MRNAMPSDGFDEFLAGIYEKIARRLEGEIVPFTVFNAPNFISRFLGRKAG